MLLQAGNGARPRATSHGVSAVLETLNRVHRFPKTRFLNERELLQPSPFDLTPSKKEENKGGGRVTPRDTNLAPFLLEFPLLLAGQRAGTGLH